jgi:hypothetical protein
LTYETRKPPAQSLPEQEITYRKRIARSIWRSSMACARYAKNTARIPHQPNFLTSITGYWSEVGLCELFMNSGIER